MAVYLIGLLVVVAAVWVFLTQTSPGRTVPSGLALAIILLLVGIGVMASARSINDQRRVSRVVHEGTAPPAYAYDTRSRYVPPAPPASEYVERREYVEGVAPAAEETVVEERRYD